MAVRIITDSSADLTHEEIVRALEEPELLPREVRRCSIGPTIGAHIGPGAVGMAYVEKA